MYRSDNIVQYNIPTYTSHAHIGLWTLNLRLLCTSNFYSLCCYFR